MADFSQNVDAGMKAAAVGAGIATTGLAIGAAVGASFGPFAPIAAPVGAALGALIGFLVSLGKHTPSAEERAQAEAHNKELAAQASNINAMLADPAYQPLFVNLHNAIVQTPGFPPMLQNAPVGQVVQYASNFVAGPNASPQVKAGAQAFGLLKTLSKMANVASDPMAYFTDPTLKALVAPALIKFGIDVNNPNALKLMMANYANPYPIKSYTPIVRKSQTDAWNAANLASGGPGGASRYAVDTRAFNPKIAPYGVSSLPPVGQPLLAPWPWGLDKDNFANPPPSDIESLASGGWSTQKKVAAAAGLAGLGYLAYAFFL